MGISVFWPPRKNHKKVAKKWPPADLSYRDTKPISCFPRKGATVFAHFGPFLPPRATDCCKTDCWRCVFGSRWHTRERSVGWYLVSGYSRRRYSVNRPTETDESEKLRRAPPWPTTVRGVVLSLRNPPTTRLPKTAKKTTTPKKKSGHNPTRTRPR